MIDTVSKPHISQTKTKHLKDCTGNGQDCWPAIKTIAADIQLSRSTVERALHDLTKAGLVEKETHYRENGGLIYVATKAKKIGGKIAVMTIKADSTLGKMADYLIEIPAFTIKKE